MEFAILGGFYEIARMVFRKLQRKDKEDIQDPEAYREIAKKYHYRYVNYQMFIEGLLKEI